MRVQGAWDLMATVLVMSFFTVILMTGSKVDASTTSVSPTANRTTPSTSVPPPTTNSPAVSTNSPAVNSPAVSTNSPAVNNPAVSTNSPAVSTTRSNNTTTESTADLPKSSYNLCVYVSLSILFYLWR